MIKFIRKIQSRVVSLSDAGTNSWTQKRKVYNLLSAVQQILEIRLKKCVGVKEFTTRQHNY